MSFYTCHSSFTYLQNSVFIFSKTLVSKFESESRWRRFPNTFPPTEKSRSKNRSANKFHIYLEKELKCNPVTFCKYLTKPLYLYCNKVTFPKYHPKHSKIVCCLTRVSSGSAAEHFSAYSFNVKSAGFSRGLYSLYVNNKIWLK